MWNNEKDLITRLLKQNIVTLCKETVSYDTQLEIDGIICISTGIESQQIVVKVHNLFQKFGNTTPPPPKLKKENESPLKPYEDSEWADRKDERRYSLLNIPSPYRQDGRRYQPPRLDDNTKNRKSEIEDRLRTPTINLATLNISPNGLRQMTPLLPTVIKSPISQIPKTITNTEQETTNHVLDDIQDEATSGSETMDYDDMGIENENEANQTPRGIFDDSGNPIMEQSSSLDTKGDLKQSPTSDENSMIECKLGKNNTTDEDLSKVPIREAKDVPCKRCGVILSDGEAYEQHNTDVHSVYTCRVCFNTFTCRNNMKRHMRLHTGFRPYSCKLCSESFTRKDDIKRHLIRHSFDKPFRCNVCKKGYMDRKTVKNHIRKEHDSKIIHICQTCGEAFDNTLKFQNHKKNHPELKMFQCTLCKFTGSNLLAYNKHQLIHEINREYRCDPCSIFFGDPIRYTTHLRKHKSDPNFINFRCCFCDLNLPTFDALVRHEHTHERSNQYTCNVCMKQFQAEASLNEHKKCHAIYNVISSNNNQSGVPSVSKLLTQQPIFPTFTSSLSQMQNVVKHQVTEAKEDIKTKEEGMDKFDDIESMVKYEILKTEIETENNKFDAQESVITGSQNDYWCGECQHGFATEHHLTEHIAMAHEGNSLDVNDIAENSSMKDEPIANAQQVENNISVDESCDDETSGLNSSSGSIQFTSVPIFNSKGGNVVKSEREVNGNETKEDADPDNNDNMLSNASSPESFESKLDAGYDEIRGNKHFQSQKHFTCDICFLGFSDFESYDNHSSLVHRKFVCHFCGKSFTSRPNRDRHVRYHTGEKPFRCDVCHQSFVRGDDLRYHRTSKHPDVKPYTCGVCDMSFPWAKDLEKHAKTHGFS